MASRRYIGAQARRGIVVDDALSRRAKAFVIRVGFVKAARRLRIGDDTLEEVCGRGAVQQDTLVRISEALAREEAALVREAS